MRVDFSVAVMQSNNDFSVGGSLSVNCHGWQHNSAADRIDGRVVAIDEGRWLNRSVQPAGKSELFSLVFGGYGLFGVILDADLRVVPNDRYRAEMEILADRSIYHALRREDELSASDIGMATGGCAWCRGKRRFFARPF